MNELFIWLEKQLVKPLYYIQDIFNSLSRDFLTKTNLQLSTVWITMTEIKKKYYAVSNVMNYQENDCMYISLLYKKAHLGNDYIQYSYKFLIFD